LNPLYHISKYRERKLDEWIKEKTQEICFERGGLEIEADEIDSGYVLHAEPIPVKVYEVSISLWTNYPVSRREFEQFQLDVAKDIKELVKTRIKEPINIEFMYSEFLSLLYEDDMPEGNRDSGIRS